VLRIGTWNLDHRWTPGHRDLIVGAACDVWLLTELAPTATLDGYHLQLSAGCMARGQHYAAVAHRVSGVPLSEVHFASAAVRIGAVTFCCSVLPWNSAGASWNDPTPGTGNRTIRAMAAVGDALPGGDLVWGGDFNHTLSGALSTGSRRGREAINRFLVDRGLTAPTSMLPHRLGGFSIDHVAIPNSWTVVLADRVSAGKLSDHDAYIVEVEHPTR
jgi:hypothetical protein